MTTKNNRSRTLAISHAIAIFCRTFYRETLSPKKSYEKNCWNGNNNKKNKRKFPSYHIEIIYGSQKNNALQQKAE
jgi:hypothetical protein